MIMQFLCRWNRENGWFEVMLQTYFWNHHQNGGIWFYIYLLALKLDWKICGGEGEVYIPVAVIFRCSVCRPFIFICSVMKRQQKIVVMSTLLHMQLRAPQYRWMFFGTFIRISSRFALWLGSFSRFSSSLPLLNVYWTYFVRGNINWH